MKYFNKQFKIAIIIFLIQ